MARALEGCTRHASVHASAVVISDEPLMERVPLYKDPKRPELITGYAMGPIEKLGLLKMDFLGLRTLTVISDAVAPASRSRAGSSSTATRLPLDDARTYQLLTEARTFGRVPAGVGGHAGRAQAAQAPSASRTSSRWWRSTARARWT